MRSRVLLAWGAALVATVGCSLAYDTEALRSGGPDVAGDTGVDGAADTAGDVPSDTVGDAALDAADAPSDGAETAPPIARIHSVGGSTSGKHYAEINGAALSPSGVLGPWSAEPALPSSATGNAVVRSATHVYVIGADFAAVSDKTFRFAEVAADGKVGPWATSNLLPDARIRLGAVIHQKRLYVIGGLVDTAGVATVHSTDVSAADGHPTAFRAELPLPAARHSFGAATLNGFVYVIGGVTTTDDRAVLRAKIQADGTLDAWVKLSDFPVAVSGHAVAVVGSKIWVVGGYGHLQEVHSCTPDPTTGDIGAWFASSEKLKAPHAYFGLAAAGGYFVALGGFDAASKPSTVVEVAPVGGPWTLGPSLPEARQFVGAFGAP